MAKKIDIFRHYQAELHKLLKEIDFCQNSNDYFYSNIMESIVSRYNIIRKKYYKSTGIPLEKFALTDYEYSKSKKTVRDEAVERFKLSIDTTLGLINDGIKNEQNQKKAQNVPIHQMRTCLKTGVDGCPRNPMLDKNKIFIGMPFEDKYVDSYDFGIKVAIESLGMSPYKADNNLSNRDIMCKICYEMQKANYLLFNISGLNPNVMLELGLSYGLGKETIIVKDKVTKNISDIGSIEYIEYAHAGDLQEKIISYFE